MLMYSASDIMQWFSLSLDVFTPKIRQFLDFDESKHVDYTKSDRQRNVRVWFGAAYCNDWFQFLILPSSIPNKSELVQVIPVSAREVNNRLIGWAFAHPVNSTCPLPKIAHPVNYLAHRKISTTIIRNKEFRPKFLQN